LVDVMVVAEKPKKEKSKKPKKDKLIVVRGKRKESIASASIKKGKGVVRVNKRLLSAIPDFSQKLIMGEPIVLAGDVAMAVDIDVTVRGGGRMGQAEAVRVAIARAFVEFTGNDELKKFYMSVDRNLLVEDHRRVEPKKYLGPKARARFQKSYR